MVVDFSVDAKVDFLVLTDERLSAGIYVSMKGNVRQYVMESDGYERLKVGQRRDG